MHWSFAKYVGCGNDFILFDNRQGNFPASRPNLIKHLCHRQWGVGANGVLLLEDSDQADFRMRIFNSDGSEAEMCGNGLRCFVKWLIELGYRKSMFRIEVMHRIITALPLGEAICLEMGAPAQLQWNIPLLYQNQLLHVHHLDTGVPHTVLFMHDIDNVKLNEWGAHIRHHHLWAPKGTNVAVAQQMNSQTFKVRSYERGVEEETLACGTGAVAVALAAAHLYHLVSPLTIQTRAGDELKVGFLQQDQKFTKVTLTGPAQCTFQGVVQLPEY